MRRRRRGIGRGGAVGAEPGFAALGSNLGVQDDGRLECSAFSKDLTSTHTLVLTGNFLPSVPQSHIVKLSALALGRGVVRRPLERTCTLSLRMTRAFGNCCMNILCGPEGAAVPGPQVRRELGQMAGQLLERDPLVRLHSPLQKFDRGVAPVAPSLRHGWQAEEATEREGAASGQTRTAEKVRWRLAKAKNSAQ